MTPQEDKAGLSDLPNEVILEQLLPILDAKDIASVSALNKRFHALANDETLWLKLTLERYNYHPATLAPPTADSGWSKRVYLGLQNPKTLVWGSADNGRLGTDISDVGDGVRQFRRRHIDHPIEVKLGQPIYYIPSWLREKLQGNSVLNPPKQGQMEQSAKTIELQASGYGFTARDSDGGVWVWGQLDGSVAGWHSDSWANANAQINTPRRLPLPCRAESICTGRRHLLVLDEDNLIWEMRSWGVAYHHTSPALTAPTQTGSKSPALKHIRQVSAGWQHSACLTNDGEIHYWFPFSHAYLITLTQEEGMSSSGTSPPWEQKWGKIGQDVVRTFDPIPPRPKFDETAVRDDDGSLRALEGRWKAAEATMSENERIKAEKVVKIASGIDSVLALKGNGEVWWQHFPVESTGKWIYLPHFSGPEINHITSQYLSINSYSAPSASQVSFGDPDGDGTPPSSTTSSIRHRRLPSDFHFGPWSLRPTPLPELDNKRVIQMSSGDHHDVALTNSGEVWTWGEGTHGQLGVGGTIRHRDEPERVIFPGEEEGGPRQFAFGITAAGWHSGVLLLGDIKNQEMTVNQAASGTAGTEERGKGKEAEDHPEEVEDEVAWEGHASVPLQMSTSPTGTNHPVPSGHPSHPPIFRVGFAGRGSAIGRVAQRNWRIRYGQDPGPTTDDANEGGEAGGGSA